MSYSVFEVGNQVLAVDRILGAQGCAAKRSFGFGEYYESLKQSYPNSSAERSKWRDKVSAVSERERRMMELRSKIARLEAAIKSVEELSASNINPEELERMKGELEQLKAELYALQFNLA